jgi:hypothetical protein
MQLLGIEPELIFFGKQRCYAFEQRGIGGDAV